MENYIKVNVYEYVNKLLKENCEVINATKKARVMVRKGMPGEKVISWTQDNEGNPIIEREAIISENQAEYVLTKVDDYGEIIIDKNGHINEWVVKVEVLEKKYEPDYYDIYRPKGGIQKFIRVTDNIILEQWGSETKIAAGGYINITNENDMYGISERDFNDTYKVVDEMALRKQK